VKLVIADTPISLFTLVSLSFYLSLFTSDAQPEEVGNNRCQYEQLKSGHPDGILKRYCGRQIAHIMGWEVTRVKC